MNTFVKYYSTSMYVPFYARLIITQIICQDQKQVLVHIFLQNYGHLIIVNVRGLNPF